MPGEQSEQAQRGEGQGEEERRGQAEGSGARSGQTPTGPSHVLPANAGQPKQGPGPGAGPLWGGQGAPLKQGLPSARESCLFRFSHPEHGIIFNRGSACSSRPLFRRRCQPIYCLHKRPPAGRRLARGRGSGPEGGGVAWTGKGFLHPSGQRPETHSRLRPLHINPTTRKLGETNTFWGSWREGQNVPETLGVTDSKIYRIFRPEDLRHIDPQTHLVERFSNLFCFLSSGILLSNQTKISG